MFTRKEGATALRTDWVHGLSFSIEDVEVECEVGTAPGRCGLVAVWVGNAGVVAMLVRVEKRPELHRYQVEADITSLDELTMHFDAAVCFAESLGFRMDGAEFRELSPEGQATRLSDWNRLRVPPRTHGAAGACEGPDPTSSNSQSQVLGQVQLARRRAEC